ncbi:MAG: cache domain-containing protein, partial [Anaerolineaceae bacterium]
MKWFNRLGMRHQLELTSLLPLVLFGLMAVVVSIFSLEQVARQLILQRNKALAQVAAASVEADLNRYVVPLEDMVEVLAAHPPSEADEIRLRESESFLGVFQGGVALLDKNGYAYASTSGHEERRGINYSFRDYFKTAKSSLKPTFSAVLKEQPSGKDAVVIAVPILRNGGFDGALIGVLFLDQTPWAQILSPMHTDQGGRAYLVDRNGIVIYRPQETSSIIGTIQSIPALWEMVQAGKTSSRLMVLDDKNNPMIVSYAVIQTAGWGLIMEEPWNSIIAPAEPYQWLMVILLLAGIFTFLVLLSVSLSKVTKPILGLEKQAGLMIKGVSPSPLMESGPLEVRSLISIFNHLLVQIREQQAALRRYAIQILNTQEEERKRLSRELHDETVQEIVGLAQRIDLSRNEMIRDPSAARRRLDEVYNLAQKTLVDVRRMSHDLKPSVLEDLGLSAAVQVCCDELTDSLPATDVRCHITGEEY